MFLTFFLSCTWCFWELRLQRHSNQISCFHKKITGRQQIICCWFVIVIQTSFYNRCHKLLADINWSAKNSFLYDRVNVILSVKMSSKCPAWLNTLKWILPKIFGLISLAHLKQKIIWYLSLNLYQPRLDGYWGDHLELADKNCCLIKLQKQPHNMVLLWSLIKYGADNHREGLLNSGLHQCRWLCTHWVDLFTMMMS